MVGAVQVDDCDQIMMITDAGTLVRTRVSEISIVGRNTQGVRLMRIADGAQIVAVARAEQEEEEDADEEAFEEASGQHASAGADAVDGAQEDRDI